MKVRAVVDTNVLFEGLTKQGGSCGLVVDAWLAGLLEAVVANALAYEYTDVLERKLSPAHFREIAPVLRRLLELADYTPIYFSWRPMSPDPGDEHVIDCAMNAGAGIVTLNTKDFKQAAKMLGLRIWTPTDLLEELSR